MFFEQYSHEPYVATPRFIMRHLPADSPRRAELSQRLARGREALDVMEKHLGGREFFVGERYSIADIALYAYTHVAADGGHDLAPYSRVCAWLQRVAAQPQHVPMLERPSGC
jgi:glutathione S-transferase